jgi:hypothetical protein
MPEKPVSMQKKPCGVMPAGLFLRTADWSSGL